jgi:Domain of unknown function (DUF4340)
MKGRGLLIAAIVLAALSGTLYWSNHRKPAESVKASADAPPKILELKQDDISKIDIKKRGSDEVELAKDGSGQWQVIAPKSFHADQDSVTTLLSTLSSLTSDRLLEDKAANLSQYGLADPALQVEAVEKSGKAHKLLIGDDAPTGSGCYVALAGDPRVFTLPSYNKTSLNKSLNDLRDKRLLTFDSDKLSRVELLAKKQDIEFGRNKDQWQIVKPKPFRAENYQVEDLIRKLKDAKMDLSGTEEDTKRAVAAFNSAAAVATVKVTDTSGTEELQVRKAKNDYYAKSSIIAGVYKVLNDLGQGLDKSVDDFRTKKLFDFGFTDPDRIEMHDGSKSYFLTKGGEDWWSGGGKKMDSSTVFDFLGKVRDLSASKFLDSGFAAPVLDVTVISDSGKRKEKILISKDGDHFVAKRENEPALYQLDSGTVSDLQKSAGEMKLAPEPKPAPAPAKKK